MSAKDRVSTAAEATAASVRQVRPLALPDSSEASAEPREHRRRNAFRESGTLMKLKDFWLIPLGAAAVVAMVAVTLVTFRHMEAQGSAPAGSNAAPVSSASKAAAIAAIPRYYAIAYPGKEGHDGKAAVVVTVGDSHTGKAVATVATPPFFVTMGGNSTVGVSATADDRSFVVGTRNMTGGIAYYLVRIAPGTKQAATIEKLPVPLVDPGILLGFAVSPDGKELAALSYRGNGTTLQIYSTASGAVLRTWTAAAWKDQAYGGLETSVSWTADGGQVAFTTTQATGRTVSIGQTGSGFTGKFPVYALTEHLLSTTAPSGDLAAASKVVLSAPSSCSSLLLTPDGGTVVCATQVNELGSTAPTNCAKNEPMFVAYSAATGKRLRVLYQDTGACDSADYTVLWADNSAQHVIGETQTTLRGNPQYINRYGVAAAGNFIKFQVVPPLSQWNSGPAF